MLAGAAISGQIFFVSPSERTKLAADESYWAEIQRAFNSDRTLVNLNTGGCSPTPSHVLEAMIRDLRFSNVTVVRFLKALIEEGLRIVLEDRRKRKGFRLRRVTFRGKGLQAHLAGGSWEKIRDLAYEGRGTWSP